MKSFAISVAMTIGGVLAIILLFVLNSLAFLAYMAFAGAYPLIAISFGVVVMFGLWQIFKPFRFKHSRPQADFCYDGFGVAWREE